MTLFQFKSVNLGQYIPGNSFIHFLDPRTKIMIVFILMTALFFVHRFELVLFYLAFIALVYPWARLPWQLVLRNIRPLLVLIGMTLILHTFFNTQSPVTRIPWIGIPISITGAVNGLFFVFRIITLVLLANLLTATTAPMSIADALYRFLKPFEKIRLPAQDIAMMISIALRFIPILMEESQRIYHAQVARGARFSGTFIQRIKSVIPIMIPLFLSTFRRANELAIAMEVRCYQSGHPRTNLYQLEMRRGDYLALTAILPLLAPIFYLR